MKRLVLILMIFGFLGTANATLWDRGGGLIYDDVLNITWLQDPNYAKTSGTTLPCDPGDPECFSENGNMSWDHAMAWASQLVYGGYDGWRLPDAHNRDGTGPDVGLYTTGSEMGHMFYNNLGGSPHSFPGVDFIDGNGNLVSFLWPSGDTQAAKTDTWWLGDESAEDTSYAWYFVIGYNESSGAQHVMEKWRNRYAWAVHDGDIGALPPKKIISLDIKPGSDSNCFNQNEKGVIPVAILGSADLDVTQINIESLALQGLAVKMAGKSNKYLAHYDYVNGDDYLDLIVQFQDSDGWISSGNGYATLTGHLSDGRPIEGKDAICIGP